MNWNTNVVQTKAYNRRARHALVSTALAKRISTGWTGAFWWWKGSGLKQYHFGLGIQWLHYWDLVRARLMTQAHTKTASHVQGPQTGVSR